jgi:hypothetical protein
MALFHFHHFAFVLTKENLRKVVAFYAEVLQFPLTRNEDFEDWGLRFNSLGKETVDAQHNWELEEGTHSPHIAFRVDSLEKALVEISSWCGKYGETQPIRTWQSQDGKRRIISLEFLPYNIELMEE